MSLKEAILKDAIRKLIEKYDRALSEKMAINDEYLMKVVEDLKELLK